MVGGNDARTSSSGSNVAPSGSAGDQEHEGRAPGGGPPPEAPSAGPVAHGSRFPAIEGVRALAALAIVVFHVGVLGQTQGRLAVFGQRLTIGVPVFFVVSAFLLYRPFVAARTRGEPTPAIVPFFVRRIARIVPLYWAALTVVWATSPLLTSTDRDFFFVGVPWWRYYLFMQVYDEASHIAALGPAWSLNVEVVFYLLLPLWAVPAAWLARRGIPVHLELVALGAAVVGGMTLLDRYEKAGSYLVANPPANAGFFAIGMALAILSVDLGSSRPMVLSRAFRWLAPIAAPAIALIIVLFFFERFDRHFALARFIVVVLVLVPAAFRVRPASLATRLLMNRHLQHVGLVSYGVYLFHRQIAIGLRLYLWAPMNKYDFLFALGAVVALTVVLASASYRYLEQPVMRLAKSVRRPRPAAPG